MRLIYRPHPAHIDEPHHLVAAVQLITDEAPCRVTRIVIPLPKSAGPHCEVRIALNTMGGRNHAGRAEGEALGVTAAARSSTRSTRPRSRSPTAVRCCPARSASRASDMIWVAREEMCVSLHKCWPRGMVQWARYPKGYDQLAAYLARETLIGICSGRDAGPDARLVGRCCALPAEAAVCVGDGPGDSGAGAVASAGGALRAVPVQPLRPCQTPLDGGEAERGADRAGGAGGRGAESPPQRRRMGSSRCQWHGRVLSG